MSTNEDRRYNGWENYETWAIYLWLSNDAGRDNYWTMRACEYIDEDGCQDLTDVRALVDVQGLADELEHYHKNVAFPGDVDGTVYSDLLNAALSEVDWHEVAEAYLEPAARA